MAINDKLAIVETRQVLTDHGAPLDDCGAPLPGPRAGNVGPTQQSTLPSAVGAVSGGNSVSCEPAVAGPPPATATTVPPPTQQGKKRKVAARPTATPPPPPTHHKHWPKAGTKRRGRVGKGGSVVLDLSTQ